MLTRQQFLGAVLAPEGKYCVVGISGKGAPSQRFFDTLTQVDAAVDELEAQQVNSFVAVASYNNDTDRTAANVKYLKSFFLDLDVGGGNDKKYPDQQSAVADVKRFVKELRLPRPMLVNSGNGVHVYWPLTEPLARPQWKVIATRLKMACLMAGVKIDAKVTSDAARILRAVGSNNWKNPGNPLPVSVLNLVPAVDVASFRAVLGVNDEMLESATERPINEVTKALIEQKNDVAPSSFRLILKKSAEGKGCNQILHAVQHQEEVLEPLWRAVLSTAKFCKDGERAIHIVSSKHPDYNAVQTQAKADAIQGPYSCTAYWEENPDGCEGCVHKGKITNPIALGRGELATASPEDNVIPNPKPEAAQVTYTIPEYPFPFARGAHGGIVVKKKDEDGNPDDDMIYENDFYLVQTIDDPLQGMSGLFRLHLPQDGVREFMIPLKEMISRDLFGKRIAEQGVSTIGKQVESLMAYSNMSVKKYQASSRAARSRVQFGWADNYTSFIVGDRQITATATLYSPPSSVTISLMNPYRKQGTLEEWKKLANTYNRPGMEPYMFGLFLAFGSPLAAFMSERCGIVNFFSPESGTGKTTILRMINSVFGHPDDTMLIKEDTQNSRINRVGVLQNIAATVDEITNETPEATSNFLYQFLHGRGKHRMQGSFNIERSNNITWKSIGVVTANSSLQDKLHQKKSSPDGELARLLEYQLDPITGMSKEESDELFRPLYSNYGVACVPYIRYLLLNMPSIESCLNDTQRSIDRAAQLVQRERFWSAMGTIGMGGGIFAREAKVLDISNADIKRVFDWFTADLKAKSSKTREVVPANVTAVGEFMSSHINDTLMINSGVSRTGGGPQEAPIMIPRGKLYIRIEPDTKRVYINKSIFRQFCAERQISYSSVLTILGNQKKYFGERKMRMGKGMVSTQPEIALEFAYENEELFDGNAREASRP
jgi:hypothetical protein